MMNFPLHAGQKPEDNSLAMEVMKAAGIEKWPDVSRVKFTFNVDVEGKRKVSAAHDWDVRGGNDTVQWGEKTTTANVWYPDQNEGDAAEAYKRWVNDSYWLLAPLKLRDKGVTVKDAGTKMKEGESLRALEVSFDNVGLTSNDRYVFYIDPATNLVKLWDYMPDETTKKTATWEEYEKSGGLNLSTRHEMGNVLITITGLQVITN
jgi:hypothetical protein